MSYVAPDFGTMSDPTLAGLLPDFTEETWATAYTAVGATNSAHAVRLHSPETGAVCSATHALTFFPNGADGEPALQEFAGAEAHALASCGFTRPGHEFTGSAYGDWNET